MPGRRPGCRLLRPCGRHSYRKHHRPGPGSRRTGCRPADPVPETRSGDLPPRFRVPRKIRQCCYAACQRQPLDRIRAGILHDRQFRDARCRRGIPSLDGRRGDVYVFKTPHHTDYPKDGDAPMTAVAAATLRRQLTLNSCGVSAIFSPLAAFGATTRLKIH